jgi:hypothetical protein
MKRKRTYPGMATVGYEAEGDGRALLAVVNLA